jgi:hypothetical protein
VLQTTSTFPPTGTGRAALRRSLIFCSLGVMKRVFLLLTLCVSVRLSAAERAVETLEGGRSPNGQLEVVNVATFKASDNDYPNPERHFEIRTKSGGIVLSQLSLKDLTDVNDSGAIFVFDGAWKVLWRADSRFVAISTRTSKFATHTVVFLCGDDTLKRVEIPEYEPFDWEHAEFGTSDNTHREPYRWLKNGDLVLDITMGYHTKSDGGITGYFATLHFTGKPPKAIKGRQTKAVDRD